MVLNNVWIYLKKDSEDSQWAAVKMAELDMMEPPQMCPLFLLKTIWYGAVLMSIGNPPTILPSLSAVTFWQLLNENIAIKIVIETASFIMITKSFLSWILRTSLLLFCTNFIFKKIHRDITYHSVKEIFIEFSDKKCKQKIIRGKLKIKDFVWCVRYQQLFVFFYCWHFRWLLSDHQNFQVYL